MTRHFNLQTVSKAESSRRHCHSCTFPHFASEQRRASSGPSANQNVGYREPRPKKLINPKEKKMSDERHEFEEIRYRTITMEHCKNIVTGMNEDQDEVLKMTVYVRTFTGKTSSIKCGRR